MNIEKMERLRDLFFKLAIVCWCIGLVGMLIMALMLWTVPGIRFTVEGLTSDRQLYIP